MEINNKKSLLFTVLAIMHAQAFAVVIFCAIDNLKEVNEHEGFKEHVENVKISRFGPEIRYTLVDGVMIGFKH